MQKPIMLRTIAGLALGALLAGSAQFFYSTYAPATALAQQSEELSPTDPELLIGAERLSEAFRSAAKKLRGSVVTITSSVEIAAREGRGEGLNIAPGMAPEALLEELLKQQRGGQGAEPLQRDDRPGRKVQTGIGSGVIVSADGYVLTNNHVVSNADELNVELSNGRAYKAKLIGADDKSDVAVLKIDAEGLMPAVLGDSSRVEVGDWVIAVGSPFGLSQTVTAGIISATNRQTGILRGASGYEDFLQTDAAINPGNSGGPLVNLRGEVIGINTAINSRTGTSAGVGFAIPANMAARIMEDLRTEGRVVRGFIGAQLDDVTAENASKLNLPEGVMRGVVIQVVLPDGPAAKGKLEAGDVVTAINGRPVINLLQMRNQVALTRPGSTLEMKLYRGGKLMSLNVEVGEQTPEELGRLAGEVPIESLGMIAATMNPQWAARANVDESTKGAIIIGIQEGRAAALGLRPGDIITEVNGEPILSAPELAEQLPSEGNLSLTIRRGNREGTISTFVE